MMRHQFELVLFVGFIVVGSASAGGKLKVSPVQPKAVATGAIIDLTKTPVGALFETKVLASNKLTWVERVQVDKVVGELELQALFSPEGGSQRAGLGKLLKADLLVVLRENH